MPPTNVNDLAMWFVEALRAEICDLERSGGDERHELLHGRVIKRITAEEAILEFKLASGTIRVPEDANGRLKTQTAEFAADVTSVDVDLIRLRVRGQQVPDGIDRAELLIDQIGLLRRLVEVLSAPSDNGFRFAPLASAIFHPSDSTTGIAALPESIRHEVPEKRQALEQSLGSEVTFIWGPPGTGKTYVIARLITACVERGERVLVTSHTKAAVDQALNESTKDGSPLANHPTLAAGQIVRIGEPAANVRIPDVCLIRHIVEQKTAQMQREKARVEASLLPLQQRERYVQSVIRAWENLLKLTSQLSELPKKVTDAKTGLARAEGRVVEFRAHQVSCERAVAQAQRAWFNRTYKLAKANEAVTRNLQSVADAEQNVGEWQRHTAEVSQRLGRVQEVFVEQQVICEPLPSRQLMVEELARISSLVLPLAQQLASLQAQIDSVQQQVIQEAKALFCTLTKNYRGDELKDQAFDTVIVDEISMALPPLLFLAAARATRRVILIGDFWQLPPIVRSKNVLAQERLGTDVFSLAGIVTEDMRPVPNAKALVALKTQRRMHTAIADVARALAYGPTGLVDDETVKNRGQKPWLSGLSSSALLIVDTADLHSWCGRQAGSLSRFNFNSAAVTVDLAAIAAAAVRETVEKFERNIGIVTPFAAQRRLLQRLIEAAGLGDWVRVGTVHTFQGGEADLIIFDSVLDDPHWSARLTNPKALRQVSRDLNVAVTRAREKFIFVGCSEWLNNHAKNESALGKLWSYLVDNADLIPALELVESSVFQKATDASVRTMGWTPPTGTHGAKFEKLDETNFFPRFIADVRNARKGIFALAPFFGEYRWPQVQPAFYEALSAGCAVTILTPPPSQAQNQSFVEQVIHNLRTKGAVVVLTSGLHGKDVIIDEAIVYTGSMNWSSNRGRLEEIHRINSDEYARICLESIQARHIRESVISANGSPRVCPLCSSPIQIVNQRSNLREWEHQPMKIGCTNEHCTGYLRPIDERLPLMTTPLCRNDGRTKYRLVARGKGKLWQCPKHPKQCPPIRFVPGDAESTIPTRTRID